MESPSEQQHEGPAAIGKDVEVEPELEIEREDRREQQLAKIAELRAILCQGDTHKRAGEQLVNGWC